MAEGEDIILRDLNDTDLVEQMKDDLYDGMAAEVHEGTQILLERGWDAGDVLSQALVEGMRIVGIDFRDGILFVPEVLQCAGAMKSGMGLLRPILANSDSKASLGTYVIGTVKGDIHDIGKNLVGMMLEGAGFEVIDLGINNPVDNYLAAIDKHNPAILGMSALLTTTMPYMQVVIEELDKRGILKTLPVMVGGAPLNQEFADAINATSYGRDAAVSAELAKALVGQNR
jgi:methanogenic corrinoid protein MtbC1